MFFRIQLLTDSCNMRSCINIKVHKYKMYEEYAEDEEEEAYNF